MAKFNVKVNGKNSWQKTESDYASRPTDAFDFALNGSEACQQKGGTANNGGGNIGANAGEVTEE